jgi:hypothetical protein
MVDQVESLRHAGIAASFVSASAEDAQYPGGAIWSAISPRRSGGGWTVDLR